MPLHPRARLQEYTSALVHSAGSGVTTVAYSEEGYDPALVTPSVFINHGTIIPGKLGTAEVGHDRVTAAVSAVAYVELRDT